MHISVENSKILFKIEVNAYTVKPKYNEIQRDRKIRVKPVLRFIFINFKIILVRCFVISYHLYCFLN